MFLVLKYFEGTTQLIGKWWLRLPVNQKVGGSIPGSSRLHVEVSLGKIPKLPRVAVPAVSL